jgi:hypothetical protein
VAAEIKRLRRLPPVDDYAEIKKQMIERLLEIAENSKNSVAQHRAITSLIRYADEAAVRQAAKDPVPSIEELLRELSVGVEAEPSEERIADGGTIAAGDLMRTLPVQVKDDFRVVPDKQEPPRLVNAAEAHRVTREAESTARREDLHQSGAEVQRLTELYQQQQEAAAPTLSEPANEDGRVGEADRGPSIAGSACAAVQRQGGTRPGFRREMIRGRFPPQYRWVPFVEAEEA